MSEPISLILEFARAKEAADPYAFHFSPQQYLLRSASGGIESATLAWDEGLLADLTAARLPGRSPVVVQRLGETLRHFLDEADWEDVETQILAATRQNREVVLTIRSAAAELYALPWELTTLRNTGQHLAELPEVLLRYEWPDTESAPLHPAAMQESGRILFAWSAAAGQVPAVEQLTAIESACQQGHYPFSRDTDVLANVSCRRLVETLATAQKEGVPFAVLHLLCHGSTQGKSFGLVLDDEDAATGTGEVLVDAGRLRQLITPFAGTLRMVVLSACDSGNMGEFGNQLGSVAQTLHRAGIAAVVASRFPLSALGSIQLTQLLYSELAVRLHSLEQALRYVRQKLAQNAHQLDWASLQLYAHAADGSNSRPLVVRPYRGLLYFQTEHQRLYFGRQDAVSEVLHDLDALPRLGKPRFVLVAGASGTGKSSMVLAGVVPRLLAQKPDVHVARIRPGSDPETPLSTALVDLVSTSGQRSADQTLLLVVDQLEEIFINVADPKRREAFVRKLWSLASDPVSKVCVIVTLRVDFVGRCGEICVDDTGRRLDSIAYDEAHRVFLSQMHPDELRAVIEKPAQAVGLELEQGLVLRMIQEVRGEPGALPVLQATLDLLWQKRRGTLLTQAAYDEIGGVAGALQGRAKALLDSFDEKEKRVARRLLLRLIHVTADPAQSTRRVMSLALLAPSDPAEQSCFNRVLDRFIAVRLLVLSQLESTPSGAGMARLNYGQSISLPRVARSQVDLLRSGVVRRSDEGVLIEVAHEALIRKWDLLQQWLLQDRQMLAEIGKLEEWVRQCKEMGTLLTGSALGYAVEVGNRYPLDLPPGARSLLKLSRTRARRRMWLRQLTFGLAILASLILLVLLWFGVSADHEARIFAGRARDALRVGDVEQQPQQWQRNMKVLRELEGSNPPPGWVDSAANALALAGRIVIKLGEPARLAFPAATTISRDGAVILTAAADNSAVLRSTTSVRPPFVLPGHGAQVTAGAFSADGRLAATAAQDSLIRIWPTSGSASVPSAVLTGHKHDILALAFHPSGLSLASASADGTVRLWQTSSGEESFVLPHKYPVYALAYSPDGQHLVTGGADAMARLWRVDTGELYATLSGHSQAIYAVAYSPDGTRILTTSEDGTARLWPAAGGLPLATLAHDKPVMAAAFSPSGKLIATSTAHRTWLRTSSGEAIASLRSQCSDQLQGLAFSPDSSQLFLFLSDHSVHILQLEFRLPTLLRRFWQEPGCLDVEERKRVLLESDATAAAHLASCEQMQSCLQEQLEEELDSFEACYAEFHRRQAHLYRRMVLGGSR